MLLLDVALDRRPPASSGPQADTDCPLRVYYMPKFKQNWTAADVTFADLKNATRASRGSKFFAPLVTAGQLVLVDLKLIDDAFHKQLLAKGIQDSRPPQNVTFALFYDDVLDKVRTTSRSCEFASSRAELGAQPRFDLVKYRKPAT